jgi:peptide/nickel transport system substrate-binding protein
MVHNLLVFNNGMDVFLPQLVEEAPSIEKGTWTLQPDGSMELTWHLRPNVKWHDGVPFTAEDLVFSGTACKDPEVQCRVRANLATMSSLTAADPQTLVVRWSAPYVEADRAPGLAPLPRHLLEEAYRTDKASFTSSPRFSTEFVGLGPYRLVAWEPGAQIELARFDDYWRGRPPLDRVIVRFLGDANTMVANVLSGAVDVVLPPAVAVESALEVRDRWQGTGNQVLIGPNPILYGLFVQLRPDIARPPNGITNATVRQGLYSALDRAQIVEAGFSTAGVVADSWVSTSDPLRVQLEGAIPKYPYDVGQAQRLLADAGWMRGADGVLASQSTHDRFEIEISGAPRRETERMQAVIRDQLKAVGADASIYNFPPALATDNEARTTRPGVTLNGTGVPGLWGKNMHTSSIPGPQNRWVGSNWPGYSNPTTDARLDRLLATIPTAERIPLQREILQSILTDLPLMPIYWDVTPVLALASVKGIPGGEGSYHTWNFFEWDKQG